MPIAIVREISPELANCELTHLERACIDIELAVRQHEQYQRALSSLGCEILSLPTQPGLADSVFVEDTALVLDEVAVICRPGAVSRRKEVPAVRELLTEYRPIASIDAPGTLDGGDLLRIGKVIYAGLSTRSNAEGIGQLRGIVAEFGYSIEVVETHGCLHLKSAVSQVAEGVVLINPDWLDRAVFSGYQQIEVDAREAHAANALTLGQNVIYPTSFPHSLDRLLARNIRVTSVDVSELQKAEGAVTCCSLILE